MASASKYSRDEWLAAAWTSPYRIVRADLTRTITAARPHIHGHVLDLACGPKPYAALVRESAAAHWGIDIARWAGKVDVVGDIRWLPFADRSFDTILCTESLEHVPSPGAVMSEMRRILAPHGSIILTTPMTWGLHALPHDYWRFTAYGLRQLAEDHGLHIVEAWQRGGGVKVVGQMITRKTASHLGPVETHARSAFVRIIGRILRPFAEIDALVRRRQVERSQIGLIGVIDKTVPRPLLTPATVALINWIATALDRKAHWDDETLGFTVVLAAHDRDSA